ncbi:DUF6929 family protein [Longimicrobium sp.]|uniref:DUF6929 family protein n=1 Tax=Longimicrobium sp. TaxID=2029185 RepID=UPI002E32BC75|nr:hypothetical protein [Longimicrobium sp.]HEX6040713.1 hypothetical protein [Longimicrobium sp.]
MTVRKVLARRDDALGARVVRTVPLVYAAGPDEALDRPAHVRAGSGLAWLGGELVCIQDDTHFVARIEPDTGRAHAVPLPAGEGGLRQFDDVRGNKRFKLDLEACTVVPDGQGGEMLLAFGSGSSSLRERILRLADARAPHPYVELREAITLYARLREAAAFSGSELNVEGAVWRGDRVLLLNRGNGAPVDGRLPIDATCEIGWAALLSYLDGPGGQSAPAPQSIIQYDLGTLDGWRLTFTDAAVAGDALVYTASAEASPNAVDDGPVAGSALGIIGADGEARWTELRGADGGRFDGKVEGIARGPRPGTVFVIVDRDDPHRPSDLCEVALSGDWPV